MDPCINRYGLGALGVSKTKLICLSRDVKMHLLVNLKERYLIDQF